MFHSCAELLYGWCCISWWICVKWCKSPKLIFIPRFNNITWQHHMKLLLFTNTFLITISRKLSCTDVLKYCNPLAWMCTGAWGQPISYMNTTEVMFTAKGVFWESFWWTGHLFQKLAGCFFGKTFIGDNEQYILCLHLLTHSIRFGLTQGRQRNI